MTQIKSKIRKIESVESLGPSRGKKALRGSKSKSTIKWRASVKCLLRPALSRHGSDVGIVYGLDYLHIIG